MRKEPLDSPYHECSLDAYESLDDDVETEKTLEHLLITIVEIKDQPKTPAPTLEDECDISEVCVVACALFGYKANTENPEPL